MQVTLCHCPGERNVLARDARLMLLEHIFRFSKLVPLMSTKRRIKTIFQTN